MGLDLTFLDEGESEGEPFVAAIKDPSAEPVPASELVCVDLVAIPKTSSADPTIEPTRPVPSEDATAADSVEKVKN